MDYIGFHNADQYAAEKAASAIADGISSAIEGIGKLFPKFIRWHIH
jgi:hypothetical protein